MCFSAKRSAYVTTGIYPVDNYYGIKATELMPIKALVEARLNAAADKARKVRAASTLASLE